MPKFQFTSIKIILLVSLFITLMNNQVFFSKASERLDIFSFEGAVYILSLYLIIFTVLVTIQFIFGQKYLLKPLLVFFLLLSAVLSYFSQELGVIYNVDMIRNIVETIKDNNQQEATELLSYPLIQHVVFYGVFPAIFVLLSSIKYRPLFKEHFARFVTILGLFVIIAGLILVNYKFTTYFSRENRDLRVFITPLYAIDSLKGYIRRNLKNSEQPLKIIGDDSVQQKKSKHRIIGVMVVGETARADHFSLNGYPRETNPELKKEPIFNFSKTSSCGTSTAYSVPCMFSLLDRKDYSPEKAARQTNVLDILEHAGIEVHWLDNNSSCKGVCARTGEINLRNPAHKDAPLYKGSESYDGMFFDEALIKKVDEILAQEPADKDVLFVLHTFGSHGPKYFKRYPPAFEKFKPACKKDTPQECTDKEIINAYDNTILYTDYVLAKIIEYLRNKQKGKDTFMIYASDHGESLGENGVYLHGLPYFIAPEAQTYVPMLAWFSDTYKQDNQLDTSTLSNKKTQPVSHDNLSHTLLGAFGVKTRVYKADHDLLK